MAENKDAFFCFCEQGHLCNGQCTAMKASEVKQRVDDGQVYQIKLAKNDRVIGNWKDIVQGEVKMGSGVQEIVLIKRDRRATRALADTVDDHEIKVSHAIRN
jgi:glutamyl/glutaminyl-tRNA synthetase